MIARTVVAVAAAGFAVMSTASAAALLVNADPTLANVVVQVPACGADGANYGVPITWIPERACDSPTDIAPDAQHAPPTAPDATPDEPISGVAADIDAGDAPAADDATPDTDPDASAPSRDSEPLPEPRTADSADSADAAAPEAHGAKSEVAGDA